MSPDSISPSNSGKEFSLTEIHARLVRSPPPITWPVSPRSNGTFSPDSSDMDVDNPPSMNMQPTRGYSPYNRSQSEEHILSPCRELLKSTEFSPVSTVNSVIEARLLFNFCTFGAVLYLRFCQFLLNKSPNFPDFFGLLFETVFYSKQSSITELTVCNSKGNENAKGIFGYRVVGVGVKGNPQNCH